VSLRECECFASMDWGFNAPGCVLWWLVLPDNALHIIREYKFQMMNAEDVAKQIQKITRELGVELRYVAADPAMWAKTGAGKGESIAETLRRFGLPMRKSDNDRFNGWMRVHEMLRPMNDERPWLTVEPTCKYLIRTIPEAVCDDVKPEDVDTECDDHALDALRYGAMSRPPMWTARAGESVKVPPPPGSWGWWRRFHARQGERRSAIA
jgi:hypothetical protein